LSERRIAARLRKPVRKRSPTCNTWFVRATIQLVLPAAATSTFPSTDSSTDAVQPDTLAGGVWAQAETAISRAASPACFFGKKPNIKGFVASKQILFRRFQTNNT